MQLKRYESDKDIDVYAFVNGLYETNFEPVAEILSLSSEELLLQALEEQTGALADEIYNLSVSRNNLSRVQKNLQIQLENKPEGSLNIQKKSNGNYLQYYIYCEGRKRVYLPVEKLEIAQVLAQKDYNEKVHL